jgi:hypothetical protein
VGCAGSDARAPGSAYANEWCTKPYPAPFQQRIAHPDVAQRLWWGAFTFEHVKQFPMLADASVFDNVDMNVNYRRDADVRISWFCASEGGPRFSDYLAPPARDKSVLLSMVASRCRNDWTPFVRRLALLIPADRFVKYGTCFEDRKAIPCANHLGRGAAARPPGGGGRQSDARRRSWNCPRASSCWCLKTQRASRTM